MRTAAGVLALAACWALLVCTGCGDDSRAPDGGDGGALDAGAEDATTDASVSQPVQMRLGDLRRDGFFAQPWPLATRLNADGTLDLDGFPLDPQATFIQDRLPTLSANTPGFGTTAAIFVAFDGALDPASLPSDPQASLDPSAAVFLVNIDEDSPDFGERVPIECRYRDDASAYNPAHFLACRPFGGFPLRGATRYALYLTDALRDARGEPVRVAPRLADVLDASDGDAATNALIDAYAPLVDFALSEDIALGSIVGGTVFVTQDPVAPMQAIAAHVRSLDAPTLQSIEPSAEPEPFESGNYTALHGFYEAPIYQQGETPYETEGGNIEFDEEGQPIVASTMTLQFFLTLPNEVPMPAGGWPIVLYHHGTTGDAASFIRDGSAFHLANAGVAMIGIDAPVHGLRRPARMDPTLLFFNVVNFLALRDNIRQGAADLLVLERFVRSLDVAADDSPTGEAFRFDPDRVFYFGHSQGGLTGPLMLAVSDRIQGAMLSGAGGSVVASIVHKRAPIDIPEVARAFLALPPEEPLDEFHPVLALVQAFTEASDSTNFAPYYFRWQGGHSFDVWLTQGLRDEEVPPIVTDALVTAIGVNPMEPITHEVQGLTLRGLAPLPAPVLGNLVGHDGARYTAAYSQYPDGTHSLITTNPDAQAQLTHWFSTLASGGPAELAAP